MPKNEQSVTLIRPQYPDISTSSYRLEASMVKNAFTSLEVSIPRLIRQPHPAGQSALVIFIKH